MSRMSKYLHQQCAFQKPQVDLSQPDGVARNEFGETQYRFIGDFPCRREVVTKDVQTANGSIVRSTDTYYLDDTLQKLDYVVEPDDKVDDKIVVAVTQYVGALGNCEGFEVYV